MVIVVLMGCGIVLQWFMRISELTFYVVDRSKVTFEEMSLDELVRLRDNQKYIDNPGRFDIYHTVGNADNACRLLRDLGEQK